MCSATRRGEKDVMAGIVCSDAPGGNWNPPTNRVWAGLAPQGAPCSPPAALGVDGVSDEQAWANERFGTFFMTRRGQAGIVATADKGSF